MKPSEREQPCLVRATERPADERFTHPLNEDSEMLGISLSRLAGMQRVGLNLIRIPPGKTSNIYHSHGVEEEFFYVLSGRGVAEIDGTEYEVGPGDFMGFPTPSVAHGLRNPFEEELVYLVGGECGAFELARFPRHGKTLIRLGGEAWIAPDDALQSMWRADE